MGTEIAIARQNLPAHLQVPSAEMEGKKEFSGGVHSGFPIISYRGRTWRVRQGGDEQVYLDDAGDAVQSVELILVQSSEFLAKTYYKGKYTEGDKAKPDCWSAGGTKPDSDVPNPVNAACQSCPMNVWGSKTTEEGKKTRACQDVRRCVVVFLHELEAFDRGEKPIDEVPVMLLRIPPASLNPLKEYAELKLAPKGLAPYMLSTKVGFDTEVSYPKLTFKGGRFLSETEFGAVEGLRDSDAVKRILDTSAEYATGETTEDGGNEASSESNAKADTPEPASPEASNTEEQHFSESADDEIAPAPTRAAAVEEDAIAPAPTKQPPKPKASKPKAASKKDPPVAESPSADGSDIDEMLSSILD